MINFNDNNQNAILNIPAYVFIAYLSHPFHNRQKQLTYATSTSIFSTEFNVDIDKFESLAAKIIRKVININIIIPTDRKYDEKALNLSNGNHKSISFKTITLEELSLKLSTPSYSINNNYYIFIGFDSWHSIVKDIYNYGINHNHQGISITGGDSSKRHLCSPVSIKIDTFLLILSSFNEDLLLNNNLFPLRGDKKLIIPNLKKYPWILDKFMNMILII